jgi:hypothetical protein
MKKLFVPMALVLSCIAFGAQAADCDAKAAEKKLAGAAKTSFVKKCEKDSAAASAGAMCEKSAADKKLAGAAKTSHIKKCTADAAKPMADAGKPMADAKPMAEAKKK